MTLWKNLVVALVAAFALAACSSSNDNDTSPTDGDTSAGNGAADQPDPALAERMAINGAIAKASAAVNALDDDSTDAQVTEAEELVDAAADAIADAGNVPAEEKLAHNRTVDEIEDNFDRATMSRTAAQEIEMKANAATAEKLFTGLAGNFDSEGTGLDTSTLAITATYGKASKVETSANAQLAEAKGMATDSSGSWSGTMISATGKVIKNTDTAMVYTDVEKDKRVDFGDAFDLNDEGYLAIPTGTSSPLIMADAFELTNAPKVHGKADDNAETLRIAGTYAGAQGDYVCTETANNCSSQGNADDHVQLNGTWVFDPDSGAKATMKDDSYASFGWWLRVGIDGNYMAAAFHRPEELEDGTAFNADSKFDALTGTAEYVGPAVGKYAIETGLPSSPPSGGHFNATATLTANFEEDAAGEKGTTVAHISGMVDNFDADPDWTVVFDKLDIFSTDGTFGETEAGEATWKIGQTESDMSGTYEGQLSNQNDDGLPGTATGTWQVQFASGNNDEVVGRMIGAFGAKR